MKKTNERSPLNITLKKLLASSASSATSNVKTPSPQIRKRNKALRILCKSQIKQLKVSKQANRRALRKISGIQNLLNELKQKEIISEEIHNVLEKSKGCSAELFDRQLRQLNKSKLPKKFSPQLRMFALTLNFFSPKAYNYVRSVFDLCLPAPRTISKWYSSVDGSPGYTKESLNALKLVAQNNRTGHPILCSLMMDEMSIRQHIEFTGKETLGYVDLGSGISVDVKATEVLVFMLVAINASWKIPVAYFRSDKLSGTQKSMLVSECINKVEQTGVTVVSLTFDGAASNITCARKLGAKLDIDDLQPYFNLNGRPILVFYDACHMIKLIRNLLGEKKFIKSADSFIFWKYIVELFKLQDDEGLHLGNKLKRAHIHFYKQKMKVKLASQIFSDSVADAIEFCLKELKIKEFEGSESTIIFIRYVNRCFDLLNSRSIVAPNYKKALCEKNIKKVQNYVTEAITYFKNLEFGNRKTGIMGWIIDLTNILKIFDLYVKNGSLSYVPTYKLSQDHLELFFGSIRSHLGHNDNPTVRQFRAAYKRLIIRAEIRENGLGNCVPLEEIPILTNNSPINELNISTPNICNFNDLNDIIFDEATIDLNCLSNIASHVVVYIAGFVAFSLNKKLSCFKCKSCLFGQKSDFKNTLIDYKTRGGLSYPSEDLVKVCKICEAIFRQHTNYNKKNIILILCNIVLKKIPIGNIFVNLNEHMWDTSALNNHFILLIKAIAEQYFTLRLKHSIKGLNDQNEYVRNSLNKLIHFKVQ